MAKKVTTIIKIQVPGGQANPAPPVGSALGQHGVNPMEFCKAFNAAVLLKREAGLAKASGEPNRNKVGKVTRDQVRQIAELKMPDLNAANTENAMRMIEGTARSMGIEIEG